MGLPWSLPVCLMAVALEPFIGLLGSIGGYGQANGYLAQCHRLNNKMIKDDISMNHLLLRLLLVAVTMLAPIAGNAAMYNRYTEQTYSLNTVPGAAALIRVDVIPEQDVATDSYPGYVTVPESITSTPYALSGAVSIEIGTSETVEDLGTFEFILSAYSTIYIDFADLTGQPTDYSIPSVYELWDDPIFSGTGDICDIERAAGGSCTSWSSGPGSTFDGTFDGSTLEYSAGIGKVRNGYDFEPYTYYEMVLTATTVPLPAAFWLFAGALGVIGARMRRRSPV